MKNSGRKLLTLLLAILMILSCMTAAVAAEDGASPAEPFDYDGDEVRFIDAEGSPFSMFAPQEGTTCVIDGNNVVIHYVPKNTTVYGSLHFGSIDDELIADVTFNEDGTFDITLPKANCGKAIPVAPIKVKDGGTTSAQYYLAIPAADKLEDVTPPAEPFDYDGDEVNFIKDDGSQFGMFTPQEGTTCVIDGNNVVIHYVPKNTTVYGSLHFGSIYDELTADVTFNEDGTFDISLPKDNCGKAIPVAPIKVKDGATTSTQYYLAIPAADKLEDVTPEAAAFDYDGDTVNFIKDDGSQFGMFAPQEGTTCVIDGDSVVIHYVPKNTTVYGALHFGSIYDELTADVTFNEDGTFDISLPKANCGKAIPVAPIKVKDGATTSTQYYLAIQIGRAHV